MHLIGKWPAIMVAGGLLLAPALAWARAPELPRTPAGRLVEARLQAFNAGDDEALAAYKAAHEPGMSIERELALRRMVGGFELLRVERDAPHDIAVLVREQDGDRVGRLELAADPDRPDQVLRFGLVPMASVPAELMPERLPQATAWRKAVAKAEGLAAAGRFSGVLAVGEAGELRHSASWGLANRSSGERNTPATRFRIASIYKLFTAVAVLRLVEQGDLELDLPILRYLPDYPNRELAGAVTIRHLLTHTGGTGDIFTEEYAAQRSTVREHSDYLRLFGHRPPAFTPGHDEAYSNYGFVLLGAILERATGQPYPAVIEAQVLAPSGMVDTGSEPEERIRDRVSVGHTQGPAGLVDTRDQLPWRGTAAGGGYSTAGDLVRFGNALLSGRLLSPRWLDEATRAQSPSGLHGLGFQRGGSGNARHFGHLGGAEGMDAALRIYPASGTVVVALSNVDPPAAETLVEYYGNRMPVSHHREAEEAHSP